MKRSSARAIVFLDEKVLLIHRKRDGREYWVTPGGGVEEGETFEEAVKRELKEEVGIDVEVGEEVLDVTKNVDGEDSHQKFFFCTFLDGKVGTGTGDEVMRSTHMNLHEVVLVEPDKIREMNVVPQEVKDVILEKIRS